MIDWDTFKSQLESNPGKVLRSVLLLAGSFLLIWILVVSQAESPRSNKVNIEASGRLDNLKFKRTAPSDSIIAAKVDRGAQKEKQSLSSATAPESNLFGIFPKVLIAFIAIGGVWLWVRSKKPAGTANNGDNIFETIGSQQLPGGQYLTVTKLNGEYWVMATGGTEGVSLLHRFSAEEWQGVKEGPEKSDWKRTFMSTLKQSASQVKKTG